MREVEPNFKQPKSGSWAKSSALVKRRSRGLCEAEVEDCCTGRGEHVHHIKLRSRGGSDHPLNLLHVCHACHGWIHDNPKQATDKNLMRSSWDTDPSEEAVF